MPTAKFSQEPIAFFYEGIPGGIQFRALQKKDYHELERFFKKNMARFSDPFPVTMQNVIQNTGLKRWTAEKIQAQEEDRALILVGAMAKSGNIVFMASAFNPDWRVPKCEVSWMLDAETEGKGVAAAGMQWVIEYLRKNCGMRKILARIDPENERSKKLALKLAFKKEGQIHADFRSGSNELRDVDYYGIW